MNTENENAVCLRCGRTMHDHLHGTVGCGACGDFVGATPTTPALPSEAKRCNCWLGTGASHGSSTERMDCPVHGQQCRGCGHGRSKHHGFNNLGKCSECECLEFTPAVSITPGEAGTVVSTRQIRDEMMVVVARYYRSINQSVPSGAHAIVELAADIAAEQIRSAQEEIRKLRAVVGKLPYSADGELIVPGMELWPVTFGKIRNSFSVKSWFTPTDSDTYPSGTTWITGAIGINYQSSEVFSTKEAAALAAGTGEGKGENVVG